MLEKDEPPVQSPSPKRLVDDEEEGLSHESLLKGSNSISDRMVKDCCMPFSTLKVTDFTFGGS